MRIACPACNAAYQVPDDQLSEGRVVRCARCGTDWAPIEAIPADDGDAGREEKLLPPPVIESQEPEPVIEPRKMALDEDIPIPRPPVLPKATPKPRGSVLLTVAWVLSVVVVGGAVAGLYAGRERVMTVWPPSIRAYAPLGLVGHPELGSAGSTAGASEGRE